MRSNTYQVVLAVCISLVLLLTGCGGEETQQNLVDGDEELLEEFDIDAAERMEVEEYSEYLENSSGGKCLRVVPGQVDFGYMATDTQQSATLELVNICECGLDLYQISIPSFCSTEISIIQTPLEDQYTLQAGESIEVELSVELASPGAKECYLEVSSDDKEKPIMRVPILTRYRDCAGMLPEEEEIDFGQVMAGEESHTTMHIDCNDICEDGNPVRNEVCGISEVNIQPIDAGFRLGEGIELPLFVESGKSFELPLTYQPTREGNCSAVILVKPFVADPQNPAPGNDAFEKKLKGLSVMSCLDVTPDPMEFFEVHVGNETSKQIKMTGSCSGNVTVQSLQWSKDVTHSGFIIDCGTDPLKLNEILEPAGLFSCNIIFYPTDTKIYMGLLEVHSTDYEEPVKLIQVRGQGVMLSK